MLTYEDCVELSELTAEEIDAIAEHEHLTEMVALEMGNYLIHTAAGEKRIKAMIAEDIQAAIESGHLSHAATLRSVLKHYLEHHAVKA